MEWLVLGILRYSRSNWTKRRYRRSRTNRTVRTSRTSRTEWKYRKYRKYRTGRTSRIDRTERIDMDAWKWSDLWNFRIAVRSVSRCQ